MGGKTDRVCPSCGDELVYVIVASGPGVPVLRRYMCLTCIGVDDDHNGDGCCATTAKR